VLPLFSFQRLLSSQASGGNVDISTVPSLGQLSGIIAAVGAFGTAAFGLVDAFKVLPGGGLSRAGFKFIREAVLKIAPQVESLDDSCLSQDSILYTLQSQWINGVAASDQINIAKSLVKLRLTPATAPGLAKATGVNAEVLSQIAGNILSGMPLTPQQADVYGRFDLLLTTLLDQAYQRADQRYRNVAKVAAIPISVALSLIAAHALQFNRMDAVLIGLIATPIAPIAKDISSAVTAGVQALQSLKG
jgi:hypothetical protein